MFAGCLQIIRVHWHLIRVEGIGYFQIIRAENADVCRSYGLCLQAVTDTCVHPIRAELYPRCQCVACLAR